jgi:Xaa-Pro aminopeptidase
MQLMDIAGRLRERWTKVDRLPFIERLAPGQKELMSHECLLGFQRAQRLAYKGAQDIGRLICEGWTEVQAAELLETWLADHGVSAYFHKPYAWFGERTRFSGINPNHYAEFMPTQRRILPGDVFILDVAPIVNHYTCDIGYTGSLGENAGLSAARGTLAELREHIRSGFAQKKTGAQIWAEVDQRIATAGFDNIHRLYPLSVLGHRVHRSSSAAPRLNMLNFGWQSYWSLLSRGVMGQLLTPYFVGDQVGLWAIEPHLGGVGFGAKFEEILVVTPDKVFWIEDYQP